ncbi:hypothetical protein [Fuerstiella marisgermanici]|uniref:Uncharacterized protein n=1 Tax=Fuerstiella marisgermanici TaxID=1891926 RepID=A0A1P8WLX4_9PLAN|nr:hypothetical protein [Fuerstiella marisgermanici]APZ95048.1 hypothetical protein Fuma_04700 [Fuerstiella marisgermanici]
MQTVFPKIAGIVLTICSVMFMGLAVASYYGRPDPIAEMLAPEISGYQFAAAGGESAGWSVTPKVGDNTTEKQHPNPYAALLDAYKMEGQRLGAKTTEMNDLTARILERVTSARAEQAQDVDALQQRIQLLTQIVNTAEMNLQNLSRQLQASTVETTIVRDDTTKRRQDVMRLQNELEELRTDRYRLQEIRRVLTDRLVRLQLTNQALEVREEQLQDMTGA